MSDYDKLLELINDERVDAGLASNSGIGTKFALGQTRHVWRYGTLSDGHEKITPAQRYYQANKEIYYLSNGLEDNRYAAMEAKADLMDAEDALKTAQDAPGQLRAQAAVGRAKARLRRALDNVQDQIRGLDELSKVVAELGPSVEAQYPQGIEQAELDNWTAIFKYRCMKEQTPGMAREQVSNVPLPPEVKAKLGYQHGRLDAIASFALTQPNACQQLEQKIQETK